MKMDEALRLLNERRREAQRMGAPEKVQRQIAQGKMTVRERINFLFDPASFEEYGLLASHYGHRPEDKLTPADGVVTGFGRLDGRMVGVIADDFTVYGGSTGVINMYKRLRMLDVATRERVPLIYLHDGAGARAQMLGDMPEGLPLVLPFIKMARMTGVAPLVGAILGPCAGQSALEASMLEFTVMVRGTGMLAAGGPPVVLASLGHEVTKEDLGGVEVHCRVSGGADNPAENDREALLALKRYLSYFPGNAWEYPPYTAPDDDPDRRDEELLTILPDSDRTPYDMKRIIAGIVDRGSFFEIKPLFAPMMITGLARLNGHPVGLVANQPLVQAGAITAKAAMKHRHFIDLCAAYHLPLIFLVDVPGVMTGPQSERQAAMRFGLASAYALAWADVPKVTVVIRKAFGYGGSAMCGYLGGQALTLAWPTVDFASLPVDSAIQAAHGAELAAAEDPEALRRRLEEEYRKFSGAFPAAAAFNIDDVIDPRETRPRLVRALELALNRRTAPAGPVMRHGVMP
ncbi:MAG: carboxyl transferase domain-containing protein [Thermodesulfobacteriota bacterium]